MFKKVVVGALGLFFSIAEAKVLPEVKVDTINGYRVIFINTYQGNKVRTQVHVPHGLLMDDPTHYAGRAHLFEHMIHRGNAKFPAGREALMELSATLGDSRNASTSLENTIYYMNSHPDALPGVIEYLGAMFSSPHADDASYIAERNVVTKEAGDYQAKDNMALGSIPFLTLLPDGHPWKMYLIGSEAQLQRQTQEELLDLFYASYQPASVTIFVAGNFKNAENPEGVLDQAAVAKQIAESFIPPVDKRPSPARPELFVSGDKMVFPIFFSGPYTPRAVEIKAELQKQTLSVTMLRPTFTDRKDDIALTLISEFLTLQGEGSFSDVLKKLDLIQDISVHTAIINNQTIDELEFDLTEKGAARRYEIPTLFFAYLNSIREKGIGDEMLALLKQQLIAHYKQFVRSPGNAVSLLSKSLPLYRGSEETFFDIEKHFAHVTSADIQATAQKVFLLDQVLVGYIGPEVTSDERAPVFTNREIRTVDLTSNVAEWKAAPANFSYVPRISNLSFARTKTAKKADPQPLREISTPTLGVKAILKESHLEPHVALSLKLKLRVPSLADRVSLKIKFKSFMEHYQAELNKMQTQKIITSLRLTGEGLYILLQGNTTEVSQTAVWLSEKFRDFVPSEEEFRIAKEEYLSELEQEKSQFPYASAFDSLFGLVRAGMYTTQATYDTAKGTEYAAGTQDATRASERVDISIAAIGDYTETSLQAAVIRPLRNLFKKPLTAAQRKDLAEVEWLPSALKFWSPLTKVQAEKSIGTLWAFRGPEVLSREGAAMHIVAKAINSKIFLVNRSRKGLGYVHGAQSIPLADSSMLVLFGQNNNPADWAKIPEGWREVLGMIESETLSEDGFKNEIMGSLRSLDLIPSSPEQEIAGLHESFETYGTLAKRQIFANLMRGLDTQFIYSVAKRFLVGVEPLEVSSTHPENRCETRSVKTSLEKARALVRAQR